MEWDPRVLVTLTSCSKMNFGEHVGEAHHTQFFFSLKFDPSHILDLCTIHTRALSRQRVLYGQKWVALMLAGNS